jgi:hypothetical protein
MPTTRGEFFPESAHFPAANFPQLVSYPSATNRLGLAFDATNQETAYFTFVMPQGVVGALSLILHCFAASAVSGGVVFNAAVEAITPADAFDVDSGVSFDTANVSAAVTVPATAGYMFAVPIPLVTVDTIAAGDYARLAIARVPANAGDTAAGDAVVLAIELREA